MSTAPAGDAGIAVRTARGAGWLVGWQMATRALGLVSTLILSHLLMPADFGLVAMAYTFSAAIGALSNLGVADQLVRRPDTDETWFDSAFTLQALRSLATSGIIAFGSGAAADWFAEPRLQGVLLVIAATTLLAGFENIGTVEFRRTLRFGMEFRLLLFPRLLQFATTVGLAWFWGDYRALLAGTAAGAVLRLLLTYVVHPYRARPALAHWRELMGFSVWVWAGSLSTLVWERCDAVVLGPAIGSAALGVYLFSAEIATLPVTELVGPAMRALYSGLSLARQRGSDVANIALEVTASLLSVVAPVAIGISATSGYAVAGLLGPKWEAARPLIAVFAWLCCVSPIAWVCSSVLTAQGQVRRNFAAIAGAAAIKCVALIVTVRSGHAAWAPLVAVASVVVEGALFLVQLTRFEGADWRANAPGFARVAAGGAAGVAALLLSGLGWHAVEGPAPIALAQGIAVGAATVALCMATQGLLWHAAGRPSGPERRVLNLLRGVVAVRRGRRAQPG